MARVLDKFINIFFTFPFSPLSEGQGGVTYSTIASTSL